MTQTHPVLLETTLSSLPFLHRGKVRDTYDAGKGRLLVVVSDRLSAFDVTLLDGIPGKGVALTDMTRHWFGTIARDVPNQMTNIDPESVVAIEERWQVRGRALVVKKLTPLPIEAIVRGYLIGSGWKDYQETSAVCGITLPQGLREAEQLPQVIFTPSTKAPAGEHDENITFRQMTDIVGLDYALSIRELSIQLYEAAAKKALERGIIIADTKFEFGIDEDGVLHLIDEVLTSDSSRFWPVESYRVGSSPPSYDKQYVRDWLTESGWNREPPAPHLPPEVIAGTAERYAQAVRMLTS